jgi:hypothetical protein
MKPAPFAYSAPDTLAEAVVLLAADSAAKVMADGQSLMPGVPFRLAAPTRLASVEAFFTVNGKPVEVDGELRTSLGDCLRYVLGLTGTHIGCERGVCGASTYNLCRCTGYIPIVKAVLEARVAYCRDGRL